ncbi:MULTISPECIES: PH domain-containing protein [unclassified Gemella]|uniref:PH domain-containing protein n=1 Tax=unclassified Gemella TaxID=2624949 RepID=UPI001C03F14F|nr:MULTISPECIES: PH domain-containing protein [unclassified Gemella]MBU0278333.1 PH domain-containing protein [Gemella sp. zg-1178]QWQ38166.1 PH domain-containing protein [Gemella sp. zg-570]
MKEIFKKQNIELDKESLKVIRIGNFIPLAVYSLIIFSVFTYLIISNKISVINFKNFLIIYFVLNLLIIAYILIETNVFCKIYSYTISNEGIIIVSGVFIKSKIFIPYNIIQSVDINKGPIIRKFGYSNIDIKTLKENIEIYYIKNENLEKIKEQILNNKNLYKLKY